jgi:hypothetical protein
MMLSVKPRRIIGRRYIDSGSIRALYEGAKNRPRTLVADVFVASALMIYSRVLFGDGRQRTRACGVALKGAEPSETAA